MPHQTVINHGAHGQVSPRMVAVIALVAVAIVVVIFMLFPEPEPEPVPAPADEAPYDLETVAPAQTEAERGDAAREVIAELEAAANGPDYAKAFARGQDFRSQGRLADAQLLYFYAARGGHAEAAFVLATMHDPNHFSDAASLADEPDPFQAYKWYAAARDAGDDAAAERLEDLRAWAREASRVGNAEAEQLLLQWE